MDEFLDLLVSTVLPIVAVVGVIILVLVYTVFISRRMNKNGTDNKQGTSSEKKCTVKSAPVVNFIDVKIISFYETLKAALPKNYIIYPNVSLELLFHPSKRNELNLLGQYGDFVIFTEKFTPSLVIDLMDYSLMGELSDGVSFKIKPCVKDVIKASGVAVLEYDLRDIYSVDELRRAIAKATNPLYADKK